MTQSSFQYDWKVFRLSEVRSPSGLIGNTGICINFIDSGLLSGVVSVDLFVVSATHKFAPILLELLRVGLSFNRRTVLGIIDCRHCHQLFLQWRLDFGIYLCIFITNNHKDIGIFK